MAMPAVYPASLWIIQLLFPTRIQTFTTDC
jgi:hypothetical protein